MAWLLLLLLCCCSDPVLAEVYRWIDEDGRVTYSDQPVPGAQAVPEAERARATPDREVSAESESGFSGPYETFEIASPEHDAVVEATEGRLDVGLLLIPALLPEHEIQLIFDGRPIEGTQRNTQLSLQGLSFGTHQIQARILAGDGAVVAASEVSNVHLRAAEPEPE